MLFPPPLLAAIEDQVSALPLPELTRAAERLIERYRNPRLVGSAPFLDTEAMRLVYLAVRLPATFAAVGGALARVAERLPDWQPESVTDLMAGPGTAAWAACEAWPGMAAVRLAERDPGFIALGREITARSGHDALAAGEWHSGPLDAARGFAPADLVLVSYGLGELGPVAGAAVVAAAWAATRGVLVLVEPGTPAGFASILAARATLLDAGASLLAPCPHAAACPLPAPEWCHFVQRLPRTRTHRLAKGGNLGYEDEKYCYLAATRLAAADAPARVLQEPAPHKAAVALRLCTPAGIIEDTSVPRRDKDGYRRARKAAWGDPWPA